ncbi:MAG: hypothetical protein JNK74_09975 [Candidatus Hydrogenedentes bacterium]|nr:hypothetical protein [Candidatus Hydrogenedentota bacterium]
MIMLKLLVAWLAVAAALAVLHRCGATPHEHGPGTPDTDGQGCRYCPSSGACHTAQPAPARRTNQEIKS